MRGADVVVIGGGPMGTAAARSLAERGRDVVLLEQFELGNDRGSTAGPTRIMRLAYPDPVYVKMAMRALGAWRQLEEAAEDTLFVQTGGLDAGPHADLCATAMSSCGARHEWLTPAEATERHSWLAPSGLERVLYHPDAGVCRTKATIAAQVRLARRAGAEILDTTPVLGIRAVSAGVVAETEAGEVTAPVCVVTAGAWAPPLMRGLGRPVHLEVSLTHVAYFSPLEAPINATFVETGGDTPSWYAYLVPDAGTGGGNKVGQVLKKAPVGPAHGPFPVEDAWTSAHEAYVRRRLPGLARPARGAETCMYAATRDDDFVLDRRGPFVLGIGFGGHGFKFAPLVGEILADLATGADPPVPLARFSSTRRAVLPQTNGE